MSPGAAICFRLPHRRRQITAAINAPPPLDRSTCSMMSAICIAGRRRCTAPLSPARSGRCTSPSAAAPCRTRRRSGSLFSAETSRAPRPPRRGSSRSSRCNRRRRSLHERVRNRWGRPRKLRQRRLRVVPAHPDDRRCRERRLRVELVVLPGTFSSNGLASFVPNGTTFGLRDPEQTLGLPRIPRSAPRNRPAAETPRSPAWPPGTPRAPPCHSRWSAASIVTTATCGDHRISRR